MNATVYKEVDLDSVGRPGPTKASAGLRRGRNWHGVESC